MSLTMLDTILGMGVGGVLGLIMFCVYRIDKNTTERRLTGLLEHDINSREENTKALTELITLITRINNGRH